MPFRMPLDQTGPQEQTPSMNAGNSAELSSIAAQMAELVRRVVALTEQVDGIRAGERPALLEVERHLRGAMRELERSRRATLGD